MIYHQRNRRKYNSVKIIIGFFIVVLIIRLFNISFLSKVFDHPINYILESNSVVLNPVKNIVVYFKYKKDLEEKNKQLESLIQTLKQAPPIEKVNQVNQVNSSTLSL